MLVEDEEARTGSSLINGSDKDFRSATHVDDFLQQIHKLSETSADDFLEESVFGEKKLEAWRDFAEQRGGVI